MHSLTLYQWIGAVTAYGGLALVVALVGIWMFEEDVQRWLDSRAHQRRRLR